MICKTCGKMALRIRSRLVAGKLVEDCNYCGDYKPSFKVDAYNIKYKMFKDYQRQKHAKDLLQPVDKRGKKNEEFYRAYGDPTKQANPNN